MKLNIYILDTLIKNQTDAIKYQITFASIIVLLGVCLILISNFWAHTQPNDTIKLILTIGGGFISTISAYPINQVISRREKRKTFQVFKDNYNDLTDAEKSKIEEWISKSIEKTI